METYTQDYPDSEIHDLPLNMLTNCFSCHSANADIKLISATSNLDTLTFEGKKSTLYTSHIFRSYLSRKSGMGINEIEKLRLQEFIASKK